MSLSKSVELHDKVIGHYLGSSQKTEKIVR
ncbi:IS1 family transposase [Glutamicibacter arilaitensis]